MLSALFGLLGLSLVCRWLFNLAVYAFPVFIGVTAGRFALDRGAEPLGAVACAVFGGAIIWRLGQTAIATLRSRLLRVSLAMLYALPAGLAGFHMVKGVSALGGASEIWTAILASAGALVIGGTAWLRIASRHRLTRPPHEPAPR